jgi:hypothetical protein
VDARTQSGDFFKTTTQKKKFEEIYNENLRIKFAAALLDMIVFICTIFCLLAVISSSK